MFDFEEADTEPDPTAALSGEEAEQEAAAAVERLRSAEWQVRYDAWRSLAKLGPAAASRLKALEPLARRERDGDVKRTAQAAVAELRAAEERRLLDPARIEETVRWAGEGLGASAWDARRDACKLLGKAGELAAPHLQTLQALSEKDDDMEVRKEARAALQALRVVGLVPPPKVEAKVEEKLPVADVDIDLNGLSAGLLAEGPHATFRILNEEVAMRLEREAMTPAEITEIWERQWGIQYARRFRLAVVEGTKETPLDPQSDLVPHSPAKVRVQIKSPGLLYNLRAAMKQFGELPAEEVFEAREAIRQQMELAAKKKRQIEAGEFEEKREDEAAVSEDDREKEVSSKPGKEEEVEESEDAEDVVSSEVEELEEATPAAPKEAEEVD